MQNNYISPYNLSSLSELKQQRIRSISSKINSLRFDDIEEDEKFEKTKERIKNDILFEPIVLGEPKFVDYYYQEVPVRLEQQFFGKVSKDHYFHEVSFSFSGDIELFMHSDNGMTVHSSDHGIIEPIGNAIRVYVDLPEINPDRSITEATSLLRLTKSIAENNSTSINLWNVSVEKRIDEELEVKRTELFRIFGGKK